MSTDRDVTRIVRSWLEEGATALPDSVLDAVLDQVPTTPQRRSRWPARRLPEMHFTLRLAVGAAAVVAAFLIGFGLWNGGQAPAAGGGAQGPTAGPSASPSSSAPAASSPVGAPVPVPNGPMTAGRYYIDLQTYRAWPPSFGVTAAGWQPYGVARVSFEVPDGWTGLGWAIVKDGARPSEHLSMAPWSIGSVFIDPCHWKGRRYRGRQHEVTRRNGVAALSSPSRHRARAHPPRRHRCAVRRAHGAERRRLRRCDEGKYTIWQDRAGG